MRFAARVAAVGVDEKLPKVQAEGKSLADRAHKLRSQKDALEREFAESQRQVDKAKQVRSWEYDISASARSEATSINE